MAGEVGALRITFGANTAQLEDGVRRASGALNEFGAAQRRGAAISGQYRAGMQQLGFQINDISAQLAMGTRLSTIFAQQSSQVIQSIQLMSGGASRFATFMGGPWGIALSAGAVVLAPLIARLFDTRTEIQRATDELAENARRAEISRQAHEAYGRTLPGVTQAIREQTEALKAQNRTLAENRQAALDAADAHLVTVQANRGRLMQEWSQLTGQIEREARALAIIPEGDPAFADQRRGAEQHLAGLRARLQEVQSQIAQANAQLTAGEDARQRALAEFATAQARARTDPEFAINDHYDDLVRSARERAVAERTVATTLANQLTLIERQRQAALARMRAEQAAARQVDRSLVRPVTGAVLSPFGSDRSRAPINGRLIPGRRHLGVDLRGNRGDPVVAPEGGVVRVGNAPGGFGLFVEIRADSGARNILAHLSAANVRSGDRVTAGQLVGLVGNSGNAAGGTPHLHYQRMVNGRWVDPMRNIGSSGAAQEAEQAAREAAQLAERRRRDEEQFQQQMAGLSADLLNARRRQVQTEEEAAADDIAAIRAEQEQRATRIRNEAAERSRRDPAQDMIAQAEAQILLGLNRQVAEARISARNAVRQQRLDEQRLEIAQRDLQDQTSVLQARAALAQTTMERRDIELRLLALQHQEELLAIQKQRAQQGLSDAQRAQLDRAEQASNARYVLGRQNVLRQTAGPLESLLAELPLSIAKLNEALENVAANGLTAISEGLIDVITGAESMGKVFKRVANQIISDLLRIAIQRAILGPLANALGGLFGGGGQFNNPFGGKVFGSVFGGPRAAGGPVLPGRTYLVGEKGPELLHMGGAGHVVANDNMGGARPITINQTFSFEGVALTQDEFVRGLMATKQATIHEIRQADRRRA